MFGKVLKGGWRGILVRTKSWYFTLVLGYRMFYCGLVLSVGLILKGEGSGFFLKFIMGFECYRSFIYGVRNLIFCEVVYNIFEIE